MTTPARVWWSSPDPATVHHWLLDTAERERCASLRQEADRARHATGRVLAKQAVAQWCGIAPEDVSVVPDPPPTEGRPRVVLPDGPDIETPWISITHAGAVVGVALSTHPCGLDVQDIDSITPLIGSDLVYDADERDRLAALPVSQRPLTACAWWVAKEAVLKAIGLGLSEPLPVVPGRGATLQVPIGGRVAQVCRTELTTVPGYVASLAVETVDELSVTLAPTPPPTCDRPRPSGPEFPAGGR